MGVARNLWVAHSAGETAAAVERQAADHARINAVSIGAQSRGAHILAYESADGGREAHSLIGTPDEIAAKLEVLRGHGVHYVLLNARSDPGNLCRFAREVMPTFAD